MSKRKVSLEYGTTEEDHLEDLRVKLEMKKRKTIPISSAPCKLDTSSPDNLLQSLLGETTVEDFFANYWEKKPLVVRRKDAEFYGSVFSLTTMKEVLNTNELFFESDINVSRYDGGEKELLNGEGQITVAHVDDFMKEEQATMQFHQPQRYVDQLWHAMGLLETYFGSLVGSNVYITPKDSQGEAPHCDDVEVFVLQLEGRKQWKLYKPMVELSRDYTQDLPEEHIGEPMLEVTLEPGDMLYYPRGVIHQAKATGEAHSTHLSVSTYQQNTWGDFMNHALTQAIETALEEDATIRAGLPINYAGLLGTGKDMGSYVEDGSDEKCRTNLDDEKVKQFKEAVKKHLSKLVDHIDVNKSADAMCADFMASRLPPYTPEKSDDDEDDEQEVQLDDKVKIKFPDHVRVVYVNAEDNDEEDDEDDDWDEDEDGEEDDERPPSAKKSPKKSPAKRKSVGGEDEDDEEADVGTVESCIRVVHSLNNNRALHMGPGAGSWVLALGEVRLDVSFAKAVVELVNSKDFVCVKDVKMEDDQDKLFLVNALLEHRLIHIQDKN